jgi:hypothetical protein
MFFETSVGNDWHAAGPAHCVQTSGLTLTASAFNGTDNSGKKV